MKSTDLSSQFHILSKYKETREKAQNAYQSSFDFKFFFFFFFFKPAFNATGTNLCLKLCKPLKSQLQSEKSVLQ